MRADSMYVLKKYHGKFDCLVYEILFIKELTPSLTTMDRVVQSPIKLTQD